MSCRVCVFIACQKNLDLHIMLVACLPGSWKTSALHLLKQMQQSVRFHDQSTTALSWHCSMWVVDCAVHRSQPAALLQAPA